MRDDLLHYYERELTYLRRTGAEFAERYPKVASRLLLEPNKCDDPHTERLLEGFAFLAARIHLRMDEDFSEISEALLEVVYPHFVRPVPSMSLVQFHLDPEQGKLTSGLQIPRGSLLYSRPVGGTPCRFRTCYDTTIWPLSVAGARWQSPHELKPPIRAAEAVAALRVELQLFPDVPLESLELDHLRLCIHAEQGMAAALYELLLNNCLEVVARQPGGAGNQVTLPPSVIQPVGFGRDEGMLPHPPRAFVGWRLLQEYFAFPEKFLFLDVGGFDRIREAVQGDRVELIFLISSFERTDWRSMLEPGVTKDTFRLGCSPIVNLFPLTAEPILLTQRKQEYPVVPDARRRESTGIFSVDEVVAVTPGEAEPLRLSPLYSLGHGSDNAAHGLFWQAVRRPTAWRPEEGTEVHLRFVDQESRLRDPDMDAVTVRLTCHNGTLPSRLPFGGDGGDFTLQGGGPLQRITALVKPTDLVEPAIGKAQMWRLISQLSLNYTSLVDGGAEALRELLRLHDPGRSASAERQIRGVVNLTGRPIHARVRSEHGLTFARGNRVEIEFDEEEFAGAGVFLLASVLERVLGLSVSLNSFCVLAARTRQRKELMREWAPRSGWKTLL
jgi:type VI secretion system protein ImpG